MAKRREHAKPTKPFNQQASLMVIAFTSALLICLLALNLLKKQDAAHYYTVKYWSTALAQSVFDNCVASAERVSATLPDNKVKAYCGCAVNKLQDIYAIDQDVTQMEEEAAQKGYPPKVKAVIQTCAKQTDLPLHAQPGGSAILKPYAVLEGDTQKSSAAGGRAHLPGARDG